MLLAALAVTVAGPGGGFRPATGSTPVLAQAPRGPGTAPFAAKSHSPRGLIPRVARGGNVRAPGSSSANPQCGSCNPPLIFSRGYPVLGGVTGIPGHVTITPVYWAPTGYSFTASYKSIVNGYLQDVAMASGETSNVFAVASEYYQQPLAIGAPVQNIQYVVTAGAEVDDATPFPAQGPSPGCVASAGFTACVMDAALQAELLTHLTSLALPIDDAHLYVALFPPSVETCFPTGPTTTVCSSNTYCAYHYGSSSQPYLVYTNQPYPDLAHCADPYNGPQAPNGDAEADSQVSMISHEASEAITDWTGAWADSAGYENGDECAYVYGSPIGSTGGASTLYNQVIGNGRYYTQDEFSNVAFSHGAGDPTDAGGPVVPGCLQVAPAAPPIVDSISPSSGPVAGGTHIVISGVGFTGASGVAFGGVAATGVTVVSATQVTAISPAHGNGPVDVSVTTGLASSAPTPADRFTYQLAPPMSACTTTQHQLAGSDGVNWTAMDPANLSLSFTPTSDSDAILGGNADLWTANAGFNQDLGIAVSGGAFPTALNQPEAWKESGGFAGTYSPNAAFVQAVVSVKANTTYTASLVWKASKPDPGSIFAGAGPINGRFSNTCVDVTLVPVSTASLVTRPRTSQYTLSNSDGDTWQAMDPANLVATMAPTAAGMAIVSANADLWTANAGYNQDIGIFVSVDGAADQLVAWKESGGFAGTFSPNAAFVQAAYPVTSAHTYVFTLKWKTNKIAPGASIFAGAGPINGSYSPTRLTARFMAAGAAYDSPSALQYHLPNSDGASWTEIDPSLRLAPSSLSSARLLISANVDLWTEEAGFNQDVGIFVSVDGGPDQLLAWKESGGFAGTFSPNAAFAETVYDLDPAHTYVFKLKWKTNRNALGATIFGGAGPIVGLYSPTRLTAQQIA